MNTKEVRSGVVLESDALTQIACLEGEIAKRDARIVELERSLSVIKSSCPDRCEVIGSVAGTVQNYIVELEQELAALKAQEPVAYISGCYRDVIDGKSDRTPLGAELAFVNMGWIGQIPLYAAPVSEAKAQGVVMPEPDFYLDNGATPCYYAETVRTAFNAAPAAPARRGE